MSGFRNHEHESISVGRIFAWGCGRTVVASDGPFHGRARSTPRPELLPELGVRLVLLAAISVGPVEAKDWTDEFRYESPSGDFALRVGGRLDVDAAFYQQDVTPMDDGAEFRRARVYVSGKAWEDWKYRFEYDFAASQDFRIKDAWLGYSGLDRIDIRAGNMQEPFSLEELTSSKYITFMERALVNALVPGYKLGARVSGWGDSWTLAGGLFEGNIQDRTDGIREGWGIASRGTFTPLATDTQVVHLGASIEYREPPGDRKASYSSRPESHVTDVRLVSSGGLSSVRHTLTWGLEAALVEGPWSLQGEYIRTSVERKQRDDLAFHGWYVFGSWFLTGESRNYLRRKGTFGQVRPKSKLGAWELALRYSNLDLEYGPITGGEENNVTLGLNWYPNLHTRLMANLIWVDADPNSRGIDESPSIVQFRAQFYF